MIKRTDSGSNPFAVQTPEGLSAEDMVSLFVDVFADFQLVRNEGHTFLNGPRGTGKSMMFRYLEPDCQQRATEAGLDELPFLGVHVPIKHTRLNLTEIERLRQSHAEALVAEHYMVLVSMKRCIDAVKRAEVSESSENVTAVEGFCRSKLPELMGVVGYDGGFPAIPSQGTVYDLLCWLEQVLVGLLGELASYLRRIAFPGAPLIYEGPLGNYIDLLCPFVNALRALPFLPKGPVYLLLDDADNLSLTQTKVLNEWVSTRSTADICLKVSTQLKYKTYATLTGSMISTPHDYDEINISAIYTSQKMRYRERMRSIIGKRLDRHSVNGSPEEFFPVDIKQERKIESIKQEYLAKGDEEARGTRARDDATRYARPDYIKRLGERRGGLTRYSYSGFEQLVHISSGVIRHFLDAAAEMYAEELAREGTVEAILPSIQDRVVREQADRLFFSEFDKIARDHATTTPPYELLERLRSLVRGLGGAFFELLISNAAERRVFSIALSDTEDGEVLDVLELGVQYGYFHRSSIGTKRFAGRTPLFILTRRLAPFFSLDPTSFAGYQFITTAELRSAMTDHAGFIREFGQRAKLGKEIRELQGVLPLS